MSSQEFTLPNIDSEGQDISDVLNREESDFEMINTTKPQKTVKNNYSQASNTFTNNTNTSAPDPTTFETEDKKSNNSDLLFNKFGLPKTKFYEKQRELATFFQKFDRLINLQARDLRLKGKKQGPGRHPQRNQTQVINAPVQIQPTACCGQMLKTSKATPIYMAGPEITHTSRPRFVCGFGRSMKLVGQVFVTSRLEKNNYNGEAKQLVRADRIKAMNARYTAKMQLERQLKIDGMKELVEKGELEEEQVEKMNQRRTGKAYHRLPTSMWSHTDQKMLEQSLRRYGKNLGKIASDFPTQSMTFLSRRIFAMDLKVKRHEKTPHHQCPYDADIVQILKQNREVDRKLMIEQQKLRRAKQVKTEGLLLPGQEEPDAELSQGPVMKEEDQESIDTTSELLISEEGISDNDDKQVSECDQKLIEKEAQVENLLMVKIRTQQLLQRMKSIQDISLKEKLHSDKPINQDQKISSPSIKEVQQQQLVTNPDIQIKGPTTRSRKQKIFSLLEQLPQEPVIEESQNAFNPQIFNHIQNMINMQMQLNYNQNMQYSMPTMPLPYMYGYAQP